jgi:hypothetical protein
VGSLPWCGRREPHDNLSHARRERDLDGAHRGVHDSRLHAAILLVRVVLLPVREITLFAGRERTEEQWRTLLLDAGFEPVRFAAA